jgi:hypothetical protein
LTIYVLGLSVTAPQGAEWLLSPSLAGLPRAEGGFETALGWFGAKWSVTTNGSTTTFTANVAVPAGTKGVFVVPPELRGASRGVSVTVDGKKAATAADSSVAVSGGAHAVVVVARD